MFATVARGCQRSSTLENRRTGRLATKSASSARKRLVNIFQLASTPPRGAEGSRAICGARALFAAARSASLHRDQFAIHTAPPPTRIALVVTMRATMWRAFFVRRLIMREASQVASEFFRPANGRKLSLKAARQLRQRLHATRRMKIAHRRPNFKPKSAQLMQPKI